MKETNGGFSIEVTGETRACPAAEKLAPRMMAEGRTPVFSCEGGCVRGEIARVAAHMVAKEEGYARACHGELFAVPHSAITSWMKQADKVVLINGCFLRCHGRIAENIIDDDRLVQFDALKVYRKYSDIFDIDDVPEAERLEAARQVADMVIESMAAKQASA